VTLLRSEAEGQGASTLLPVGVNHQQEMKKKNSPHLSAGGRSLPDGW